MPYFRSWIFDLGLILTVGGGVLVGRGLHGVYAASSGLGAVAGSVLIGGFAGALVVIAGTVLLIIGAIRVRGGR